MAMYLSLTETAISMGTTTHALYVLFIECQSTLCIRNMYISLLYSHNLLIRHAKQVEFQPQLLADFSQRLYFLQGIGTVRLATGTS